jgi:hypothetical protein
MDNYSQKSDDAHRVTNIVRTIVEETMRQSEEATRRKKADFFYSVLKMAITVTAGFSIGYNW